MARLHGMPTAPGDYVIGDRNEATTGDPAKFSFSAVVYVGGQQKSVDFVSSSGTMVVEKVTATDLVAHFEVTGPATLNGVGTPATVTVKGRFNSHDLFARSRK